MSNLVTKSEIFAKSKVERKKVYVPAWGGDVYYLPMNMATRRQCREKASSRDAQGELVLDNEKLEIQAIICCTLAPDDVDGKKFMFGMEDEAALEETCAAGPLSVLSAAILQASGLGQEEVKSGEEKAAKRS